MNEHDSPIKDEKSERPRELPPIPDGGLSKGMPSWLADPPVRPSKLAGNPTPFDLHTLVGSTQLPHWLGDLSERVARDAAVTASDEFALFDESPMEAQVPAFRETVEERGGSQVQAKNVDNVAEPVIIPSAPMLEPKNEPVPHLRPLQETKSEVALEPRSFSTYLLYALAVLVVVALVSWLVWG